MTETTETCPEDGEQPVVDVGPAGGVVLACGHGVERRGDDNAVVGMVIDGAPDGRAKAAAEREPSEREPNLPRPRFPEVVVPLIGEDGNALAILGRVRVELCRAGVDRDEIDRFTAEATDGDYDELLATVQRWVEVE